MSRRARLNFGSDSLRGIAYKALGVFAAACVVALVKTLIVRYPVGEIVFFRSIFMLIPVLISTLLDPRGFALLKTRRPMMHISRALSGTAAIALTFVVLRYLPLGDATALNFLSPFFLVAFAALILKERVGRYRLSAVSVGFLGIVFIASPHIFTTHLDKTALIGVGLGVLCAITIASSQLALRALRSEPAITTVFYFTLVITSASALTLPFAFRMPASPLDFALLVATGLFGGLSQLSITQSYRFADASLLATIDYSQIVWAILFGYVIYAEVPVPVALLGTVLVTGSGIVIALRERTLARRGVLVERHTVPPTA